MSACTPSPSWRNRRSKKNTPISTVFNASIEWVRSALLVDCFPHSPVLVYLPCMHFLFVLCLLGIAASIYSLVVRWDDFRKLQFSPAHAAFCAPCLSHANAIQAYRAAVNSFSDLPAGSPFLVGLYVYWLGVLVGGTCVTLYVAGRYIASLPSWTHFDLVRDGWIVQDTVVSCVLLTKLRPTRLNHRRRTPRQ